MSARDAHGAAARVALAVWLHGEAARQAGPALVASDLEPALRGVLHSLATPRFEAIEGA
jgi:NAD(P)H-hydrate repair Nnr-like enzyme with NAD(P)H-hydrate dehydratase domain